MDLNHRPHPYQMCESIRTVRIMNDQVSTVGAGKSLFSRGQRRPGEIGPEQRVAGRFFEFSLSHPARSARAVVQQRERPRRSVRAAVIARLIAASPCQNIQLPRIRQREMHFLSPDQVSVLATAIGPNYETMIYFAAYTGLRWGESAGLKVKTVGATSRRGGGR